MEMSVIGPDTLAQLQPGETAILQSIKLEPDTRKRLQDLGFVDGAEIQCLHRNFSGSSSAYLIHGTVIALRHTDASAITIRPHRTQHQQKTIVLAGNPNVGKSTLFNSLTGQHQHTGNWSGKTVSLAKASCQIADYTCDIVDLPGCYSLSPVSRDEQISYDYLMHGPIDAIVVVCDINCLERNLLLALQIKAMFAPVVLAINCMDDAARKGIQVNMAQLAQHLDLSVVALSATTGQGVDTLLETLHNILEHHAPQRYTSQLPDQTELLAEAHTITERYVNDTKNHLEEDRRIDRFLLGKWTGIPIMLLLLTAIFWLTMSGANYPSKWLSILFAKVGIALHQLLILLHLPDWLQSCLMDGMYQTLSWVVSVMLPPMAIFFPLFTILEECGYLPRVAFHLDHCFQKAGACGNQCMTTCMAFGCNAAGVTGCRIIASPRERMIAILTNSFTPCNGRLPILVALLTIFFASEQCFIAPLLLLLLIAFSFLVTLLVSKLLSKTVLCGLPSSFILELPPYRKPQIRKIIVQSLRDRTLFVLLRAVLVAAPAGLFIWLLSHITLQSQSLIMILAQVLDPLAAPFGMDGVILLAFLLGWPANEIVIPLMLMMYLSVGSMVEMESYSTLYYILTENGWTWQTALSVLIFSLFHWPCSTTCLTIHKETASMGWTILAILLPTSIGLLLCFLFRQMLFLLGMA